MATGAPERSRIVTARRPGMDHAHYLWQAHSGRGTAPWPGNAPLAVCSIVHLEHFEPPTPIQHSEYSRRAYGNRIGIFRMMEAMARAGLRGTAALDVHTAQHSPFLVDSCRRAGWEIIGHGLVGNEPISSAMSEDEERASISRSLALLEEYTGVRPVGWLGPEFGESTRTPALLAEQGLRYVCDWPNDERPYAMTVPKGTMTALPILLELDDAFAIEQRHLTAWRWQRAVEEAADVMIADIANPAPLLALSLHPWIMGQPHRIRFLADALQHLAARGAWFATGREAVEAAAPGLAPT